MLLNTRDATVSGDARKVVLKILDLRPLSSEIASVGLVVLMCKLCMSILVVWASSVALCRTSKVAARLVQHVLHVSRRCVWAIAAWAPRGFGSSNHNVSAAGISHLGWHYRSGIFGQQVRQRMVLPCLGRLLARVLLSFYFRPLVYNNISQSLQG